MMKWWIGAIFASIVLLGGALLRSPPPYIVDSDGVAYTQAEYEQIARGWVAELGYTYVCVWHLGSVTWPTPEETYRWRQVQAIVKACNEVSNTWVSYGYSTNGEK